MKYDLLDEANDTKDTLSAEGLQRPDIADRAQVESDASIQLRTRDRERKLISKIDALLYVELILKHMVIVRKQVTQ